MGPSFDRTRAEKMWRERGFFCFEPSATSCNRNLLRPHCPPLEFSKRDSAPFLLFCNELEAAWEFGDEGGCLWDQLCGEGWIPQLTDEQRAELRTFFQRGGLPGEQLVSLVRECVRINDPRLGLQPFYTGLREASDTVFAGIDLTGRLVITRFAELFWVLIVAIRRHLPVETDCSCTNRTCRKGGHPYGNIRSGDPNS